MTSTRLTCPFNCSARGTCSLIEGGMQHCNCFDESVGSYCSRRSTELPSHLSCNGGHAVRRGFEVKLTAQSTVDVNGKTRRYLSARSDGLSSGPSGQVPHIPVVTDGVVLPDWRSASTSLPSNGTETLSFDLSIQTPIPATIGVPLVHVDEPNVLSYRMHLDHDREIRLWQDAPPRRLQVTCECIQPGRSKMVLSIPMPGFCTIEFSWVKICTAEEIIIEAKRQRALLAKMAVASIALVIIAVIALLKLRKRCYKMCCQVSSEYGSPDTLECCLTLRRRAAGNLAALDGMVPLPEEGDNEDKLCEHGESTRFSLTYELYSFWTSIGRMQTDLRGEDSVEHSDSARSRLSTGTSSTQDARLLGGQNLDEEEHPGAARSVVTVRSIRSPGREMSPEDDLL